jgi:hypothetical protein
MLLTTCFPGQTIPLKVAHELYRKSLKYPSISSRKELPVDIHIGLLQRLQSIKEVNLRQRDNLERMEREGYRKVMKMRRAHVKDTHTSMNRKS